MKVYQKESGQRGKMEKKTRGGGGGVTTKPLHKR